LSEFFAAEALDTNYAAPHLEAAKVFFEIGRDADGLNEFRNAVRLDSDNYKTLAVVAHYLAANENAAARDGRSALVFALAADELSGHVQPVVQDYLGMAFAETGDFTNAVTCAQNALALANAFQMKDIAPLQNRLQLYQARRPWHESFRITSAPAGN
jgi:tetratricopeptide (TPR) repeat protein